MICFEELRAVWPFKQKIEKFVICEEGKGRKGRGGNE